MSDAVRQRYRLATGGGQAPDAPRTPGKPGFRSGGTVKKASAGGQMYRKGGSPKKR